ncbi:glycosyltransferase, partial [Promineifilum sp.]|uniref:MGDG synthase family glycosyltransferase n=1 Tax=Promineifilum sp. TaxID=2664178 RepID=UPI0035B1BAB7
MEKRVLILTADAGFGHRSAANAVAKALEMRCGDDARVAIVNPLDEPGAPPFLRSAESDYDKLAREWPLFYKLGYKMTDMALTTSATETAYVVIMYDVISRLMRQYRPNVVVVTFPTYQYPVAAYRRIKSSDVPMATVVTDLISLQRMWFHPSSDLCLVPTQTAADLALERGLDPESVHVTGLPVNPALADVPASKVEARAALGWPVDKFTILAVGSKRVEGLDAFVRVLNHAGFDIHVAAVAGGNDELFQKLQAMEWHIPNTLYNMVNNMPDMMHAANCVISKAGGLIVTESLACGLPLFLMQVIPGQETGNAQLVSEGGAGDLTLEPLAFLEALGDWLADGGRLYQERAANARRLGRPDAAFLAADLIWDAARVGKTARRRRFPISRDKMRDLLRQFGDLATGDKPAT